MDDFFDFSRIAFGNANHPMNTKISVNSGMNDAECGVDTMPLAMAYVPIQKFGVVYEPDKALTRGTIFPDLDKPFYGCKKNWRDM